MDNLLLTAKALHIIFVVSWFAGLFYIPRLYIYIVEAKKMSPEARVAVTAQLKLMAKRLWFIITWPAGIIAVVTALAMLWIYPPYLQAPWMHVKLGFVALLIGYHISLHVMYKKIQADTFNWTSTRLRFYNELATILLFAIVFTVVFKNTMSWAYGAGGIILLGVVLSLAIMAYKKYRNKKAN